MNCEVVEQVISWIVWWNEPKNQTIVKTIIALARGLNINVLAEGVESALEMEFLRDNGVDSIQGYYYFKPISTEAMEALFHTIAK